MHRKHVFLMILCCALPVAAILLLPLLGVPLNGGLVPLLLVMLCPLSHLLMMGMLKGGHQHGEPKDARLGQAPDREGPVSPTPGHARTLREKSARLSN